MQFTRDLAGPPNSATAAQRRATFSRNRRSLRFAEVSGRLRRKGDVNREIRRSLLPGQRHQRDVVNAGGLRVCAERLRHARARLERYHLSDAPREWDAENCLKTQFRANLRSIRRPIVA